MDIKQQLASVCLRFDRYTVFKAAIREAYIAITSMRMAIYLLLMLSIFSIPGTVLPQKNNDISKVLLFYEKHKTLYNLYNYMGFFDNYRSFIFLSTLFLLYFSVLGCIVPRTIKTFTNPNPQYIANMCNVVTIKMSTDVDVPAIDRLFTLGKGRKLYKSADKYASYFCRYRWSLQNIANLIFHWSLILFITFFTVNSLESYSGEFSIGVGDSFQNLPLYYDSFRQGAWVSRPKEQLTLKLLEVKQYPSNKNKNRLSGAGDYISKFRVNGKSDEYMPLNRPIRRDGLSIVPENYFIGVHAVVTKDGKSLFNDHLSCRELFAESTLSSNPYACLLQLRQNTLLINLEQNSNQYSISLYDKKIEKIGDTYTIQPIFFMKDILLGSTMEYDNMTVDVDDVRHWGTYHVRYSGYIIPLSISLCTLIISLAAIFSFKPRLISVNLRLNRQRKTTTVNLKSDTDNIVKLMYMFCYDD